MLSLQPATRPVRDRGKIGLAIAGGGPLGAIYELGTLHALDEALEGVDFSDLHVYVGVSSGAIIASSLANGISTPEMGRIFINSDAPDLPMTPEMLLQPAIREFWLRASSFPRLALLGLLEMLKHPLRRRLAEVLNPLTAVVPTGIFRGEAIHEFLTRAYSAPGRSNDFRTLRNQLYVVATDLNTGKARRFGAPGHDHVPISRAVQASASLPGLFPPTEIDGASYVDGALRRTMHASLALDDGCTLMFCVNPLVPYTSGENRSRAATAHDLKNGGLPLVLSQTFRALIHSRMQVGMQQYRRTYPRADVLLLEPDRDDDEMFFTNVFSYAGRRRMAEHAYQRTRADLLRQADELTPLLARHDVRLNTAVLVDSRRSFQTAVERLAARDRRPELFNRLDDTLEDLQRLLDAAA